MTNISHRTFNKNEISLFWRKSDFKKSENSIKRWTPNKSFEKRIKFTKLDSLYDQKIVAEGDKTLKIIYR